MEKYFTPVKIWILFLLVGSPVLGAFWSSPDLKSFSYPQPSENYTASWYESPKGIFAVGFDDCDEDTTKPTIFTKNITVQLNASGSVSITAAQVDNGSDDNCGIKNYMLDKTQFDCGDIGTNTVTLTVIDENNNSNSKTATVTVEDQVLPVARAKNITVQLDENGNATIDEDAVNDGSSDACSGLVFDTNITSFDCSDVGTNTVILTVTDANGNKSTANATVTVKDEVKPVAKAKNITVQLDANGNATIDEDAVNDGSSDACSGLVFDTNITSFDCSDVGTNTVILTVTDANGNKSTANATVTVKDEVKPVAKAKNITVQLDANGNATIDEDAVNDGSSDACSGLVFDTNITSFDCSDVGTNTVILTVTDANGNKSTANATVTVKDEVKPVAKAKNITVQLDANGNATIDEDAVNDGSSDACSGLVFDTNITSFDCSDVGTNTVILTVTDANGNKSTANATVTVKDEVKPVAKAKNITVQLDANGNATIDEDAVNDGSSDACSGLVFDTNITSFDCSDVGPNAVVLTVTDTNGNKSTANATVTVEDEVNPIASAQDLTIYLDEKGTASITPEEVNDGSSDNCGISGLSLNKTTFNCSNTGDNQVTLTIIDVNGNLTTATAVIKVIDDIDPEIPTLQDLNWSCGREITDFPTTTDNCDEVITGTTINDLSFNNFGEYIITWTFTDSSNNSVTADQKIIIPEPTVDVPAIDGSEFCNTETIPAVTFTGNNLANKSYSWSYKSASGSSLDIGLASSGTGNIPAFTAKNNTNESVTAVIEVIPFGNACEGDATSFSITIHPTPSITKPNDIVVCEGETISKIDLSHVSVTGSEVAWSNDNTNIGLSPSGNGDIAAFVATTNGTHVTQVATISLTPSANDCTGEVETFTITVKPRPEVNVFPDSQTYCNGQTTEILSLGANVTGTKFNISGGSAIGLSNRTNVTEIPAFTAKTGTATVTITPVVNGCTGTPVSYDVTVNPTPTVSVSPASQQICSGESTSINLSGSGTSFSWTIAEAGNEITGASEGSGNQIIQTLSNSSSQPQVVKYRIVPEANGCTGTPISVTVTVNPLPSLIITNPETICSPAIVDLTSPEITTGSTPNLTFTYWKDISASIPLSKPTETSVGTYYIKAENTYGCSVIKPVVVTEKPTPNLTSPTQAAGFCSGTAFEYTFSSDIPGTEFRWTRPQISGISTPANSETGNISEVLINTTTNPIAVVYEVIMVSPEGCIQTAQIETTVTPTPLLSSTLSPDGVCSGTEFGYIPTSSTGGTVFSWTRAAVSGISNETSSGTGAIKEVLNNTTQQTLGVTYRFVLSSNNCTNPQVYNVVVSVTPSPDTEVSASRNGGAQVTDEITICRGDNVDLFSKTSFANSTNLPSELLSANFNTGKDGWQTPTNGNRWRLTNSGTVAYEECSWVFVRDNSWWGGRYEYRCEEVYFNSSTSDQFFLVNSHSYTGNFNDVKLTSPSFNTEGYNTLQLTFWHHYRDGGGRQNRDYGILEYNTGNGWQEIDTYTSTEGEAGNFVKKTYNISNLAGQKNVQIRFRYDNANDDWYWAVDNISVTGDGVAAPEVKWTSDVSDWTSTDANPKNVNPQRTTVYTATYTDPDTGCPGSASVKVVVNQPEPPSITANYCGDSTWIELVSDNEHLTYKWESRGELLGTNRTQNVQIASTYTLTVTNEFGCESSASINVSEELLVNGNFENGVNGFYTEYRNKTNSGDLYPEGDFAVDRDASDYHNDFDGRDHTSGNGKFMIINGAPGSGKVIWRQTIENIQPNTDYYFSAWGTNVNPKTPARLQFRVNGVPTGTIADLRNIAVGEWIQFYSNPFWNSQNATTATLEIINLETIRNGNDFGLDDISFGTLEQIKFSIDPIPATFLCEGEILEITPEFKGGREPFEYTWTSPNGEVVSSEKNLIIENVTADMTGQYKLTVTDFYGCEPQEALAAVNILGIDAGEDQILCSNIGTVQLNGNISGSNGGGTWSTNGSGTFSNNKALDATYTPGETDLTSENGVTLTLTSNDPNATCTDEVNISFYNSPLATVSVTPVNCFGAQDGTATVTVTEGTGTAPFTYQWKDQNGNTVGTTQTVTNLSPSESGYSVIVTDANGCQVDVTGPPVLEPSALQIDNTSVTNVTCFDGEDGSATISVSGGMITGDSPNYTLTLLNNNGSEVASEVNNTTGNFEVTNLKAGAYTFTANTAYGCTLLSENITIDQPLEIIVDAGEDIIVAECGISKIQLNAIPVDPNLGTGRWEVIATVPTTSNSPTFENELAPNTWFTGQANTKYEISWVVTPIVEECKISDTVVIELPPACSRLNFDGNDDFVDLGDHYDMVNSNLSIEAWIKPHDLTGTRTIISKREEDKLNSGYDLILSNGAPAFRVGNKSVTSVNSLTTDRWFHVAGVYSGNELQLYVDGILVKSNSGITPNAIVDNSAPAIIGATYASSFSGSKNNFSGFIEEVRIWNTGISVEQIRFYMNQRLEKINDTQVNGSVLGNDLNLPNAPEVQSWSKLPGYYQLLAEEGLIANGFTVNLGNLGNTADGNLKNIEDMQENTAPLPYKLFTNDGNWFDKNTWQLPNPYNGRNISMPNVWNAPNTSGINGDAINWNIVDLNGKKVNNPTSSQNITLLGLLDKTGTLTLKGENNKSGTSLTLTHYFKLDGVLDLNGESQLLQPEGSKVEGSGYLERDQQGTASSYNYNYWSSPVSIKGNAPNSGYKLIDVLMDGSKPENPKPIDFNPQYHYADHNYSEEGPIRISSYWLNQFFGKAGEYSKWKQITPQTLVATGEGFTMKGSRGNKDIKELQNYTFRGMPNNGTITLNIGLDQNYLIGNPYPSAIDASEFIRDNLKNVPLGRNSQNVFNGSIYFWSHFANKTHILTEYVGGYAIYNLAGGIRAIANDARINNQNPNRQGGKKPRQYIAVGQGFFINTVLNPALSLNPNVTITGGEVKFNNSQRVFQTEADSTKVVFHSMEKKTVNQNTTAEDTPKEETRMRLWLKFESPAGYHRQLLVTRDTATTSGFDLGYDAPLIENNKEDMYWLMGEEEDRLVIQGVPDFDTERVLPLGLKISTEGEFTIAIDEMENIPDDLPIYIRDNATDTYYNLRASDFTTTIEAGEIHDRYSLVFHEKKDDTEDPGDGDDGDDNGDGSGDGDGDGNGDGNGDGDGSEQPEEPTPAQGKFNLVYSSKYKEVVIQNPGLLPLKKAVLFNALGQEIHSYSNIELEKISKLPIKVPNKGMYFVRVYTEDFTRVLKFLVDRID
ncbi:LamG-like jellyroll fold domain-containing protein [Salinimicrobium sp. 3283s]|uniref:PKD-like domain-containing protein n=1 Tax=Salinimicrobium sp. 3283s TaxID=3114359 RepID=UPI0031E891E5